MRRGPRGRRPDAPAWLARPGNRIALGASAIGLERWARIGAVVVIPLLLVGDRSGFGYLYLGLAGYVLLTGLARRDRYLRSADLMVSAALILLTGPELAVFLPFLLVTVAGPAAQGGLKAGLAAGGTLAVIALVPLLADGGRTDGRLGDLLPLILLLLGTGLTTALAADVVADRAVRDRLALERANRLLSALRDLAEDIPGGLDVTTVSAALVAELRAVRGLVAAVVLTEDSGLLRATGATGLDRRLPAPVAVAEVAGRGIELCRADDLPGALARGLGTERIWWAVPLGEFDAPNGLLLAGFDRQDDAHDARGDVASIARDGALALDNARLFDGTRTRAADAARRRVAADLHDGVAQSLTHLRMELELLARSEPDADGTLTRLARVAGRALADLRATIDGLRNPADGDLHWLLARHVEDVRSDEGPAIELVRSDAIRLAPGHALELLRIAQEAISNAVRHAAASRVTVALTQDATTVELRVADDGIGLADRRTRPGGGVGLESMRERAADLGGVLELGELGAEVPGGPPGTVVIVRIPRPGGTPAPAPSSRTRESPS